VLVGQASTALMVVLALVVVNIGIAAAKAPLWAMPSVFLSGAGAAAGIAMINSVGNLGGFVGPFVIGWLKNVTGTYSAGLYVVAATLAVSAVVTVMLSRQARRPHAPAGERHSH
jgi:ACS family tartrate transporter-like MFS transporter